MASTNSSTLTWSDRLLALRGSSSSSLSLLSSKGMRLNKNELANLASEAAHKFDREGSLVVLEKQESFFRKTELVSVDRWCRLRGNLLFVFKSREAISDPLAIIILENCQIVEDENNALTLQFQQGGCQFLRCSSSSDRESWASALRSASHSKLSQRVDQLRSRLAEKLNVPRPKLTTVDSVLDLVAQTETTIRRTTRSVNAYPLLELALHCDNLLCDALGRAPSVRLIVLVAIEPPKGDGVFRRLGQTEVVERSSNPSFVRTLQLDSDVDARYTRLRIVVYAIRERFLATAAQIGRVDVALQDLIDTRRLRMRLESSSRRNPNASAGFVTVDSWSYTDTDSFKNTNKKSDRVDFVEKENKDGDKGHRRLYLANEKELSSQCLASLNRSSLVHCHRRSNSLPPCTRIGSHYPDHGQLESLISSPTLRSYRFHSGLGGDINVQELMAESKLTFAIPQQLISLWICEEVELVHEIAGLGELKSPWHECQMQWLQTHLSIINSYSQALESMETNKNLTLRRSTQKSDRALEFVATNLHLQRLWASSLRRHDFFDLVTHGAFTAFGQKGPGLIKMLKELKAPQRDSRAWNTQSDELCMAEDTLQAVRRVRKEVIECMRIMMRKAKEANDKEAGNDNKKREECIIKLEDIVDDMQKKTKCLSSMLDASLVSSTFSFLESARLTQRPERDEFSLSVSEFLHRNKLKIDLKSGPSSVATRTIITPNSEFVSKELRTPEVADLWPKGSGHTSGYHSVDRLSDIDEFEESFKYLSVVDRTKHYYTLCRDAMPEDTPPDTPTKAPLQKEIEKDSRMEVETETKSEVSMSSKVETNESTDSPRGLHYRNGDEPEPLELTQLNMDASMMCLASKIRSLRHVSDLTTELRPSMRKLRQGMDALCKTARLVCTVTRLRQKSEAITLAHDVKYRRDVCFSQALSTLITGLMIRLWSRDDQLLHFLKVCCTPNLGPLVTFESLLSMHGEDVAIFNDMLVAIEDLRSVNFTLVTLDKSISEESHKLKSTQRSNRMPLPRIAGCRSALKVLLPVPNHVHRLINHVLSSNEDRVASFSVVPVLFNVGINEQATLAGNFGLNGPQEKNNSDNYRVMADYARKYNKISFHIEEQSYSMISVRPEKENVDDLVAILRNEVNNRKNKNVELLQLAAQITRRLGGLRFTCCKSGKDRTGMSSTLEQTLWLSRHFDLADHQFQRALDTMRSEGTRRENVFRNTGGKMYAFNALQFRTLPTQYRPPEGSFGSNVT